MRSSQQPPRIADLDRVRGVPFAVAAVLGLLGVLTLTHLAVSSVRERRRDLATLKALGFDRRQVRATVGWQTTVVTTAGAVVGVPIGVLIGRIAWSAVVDGLHLPPAPVVPVPAVLAVVITTLVLANVVAAVPGRAAARTPAAVALRADG